VLREGVREAAQHQLHEATQEVDVEQHEAQGKTGILLQQWTVQQLSIMIIYNSTSTQQYSYSVAQVM